MIRTTIMLPEELKAEAMRQARKRRLSFGQLVREALEMKTRPKGEGKDPFFDDDAVFDESVPADFASNHDVYLYGDGAK